MASVFLSYSREDAAKAEALAAALERLGHSVWWDRRLHGGSRFSKEIERALKGADVVLVMWSRAGVESAWVQDEAAEGRDSGRLIPVVIDDSKPPLGFRQYHTIDMSGWKGRGNPAAIHDLHEAIVAQATATAPQQAESGPAVLRVARDYRRLGLVAAGVLVVSLAALLAWFARPAGQQDEGTLRLRLGHFEALSQDVPASVPDRLREELLAALATDAVIVATTEQPRAGVGQAFELTAAVQKVEDSLRFTAHLVDKRTDATVWTEMLDLPATAADLAPRQAAVSLSQVLRCGLGGLARYRKPMPDETLSIWMNFCEEYWSDTRGAQENPTREVDLTHRLTEAAPDFSRGWSALAEVATYVPPTNRLVNRDELRAEAAKAAKRALELDPQNSEAYQALASLQPPFAFADREKLHVKSVTVQPSDCGCEYLFYAGFLNGTGRNSEAVEASRRAHDMIPLSAEINARLAEGLFVAGQPDEARRVISELQQVWPDYRATREILIRSASWTGNYDEALKLLADPKTELPEQLRAALAGSFRALRTNDAAAKANAAKTLDQTGMPAPGSSPEAVVSGPLVADALAALGANKEALSLAAALIQRDGRQPLFVLFEPPFAAARRTPEFAQLVQRLGLITYWHRSGHSPDFCKEASPPALCARL